MKKTWALCALPLIALLAAPAARAVVSLDYYWSNVRCGITSGGVTTYSDCATPSFSATVEQGGSVFVSATFNYSYHDDGLAIDPPEYWQFDARGWDMRRIDHEAAMLLFFTAPPPPPYDRTYSTNVPFYFFLGNDAVPTDITGSRDFSWTTTSVSNYYPGPATLSLSATLGIYHSEVAAVPEPSTVALMALGLAGLAAFTRRRRPE